MQPEVLGQHFALPTVRTVTPVRSGLLHATYRVMTVEGDFVAQRLHDAISDSAIDDMRTVTAYLVTRGLQVPSCGTTAPLTSVMRSARGATARLKTTRMRRSMSPSSRPLSPAMPRALVSPPVRRYAPGMYVPRSRSPSNSPRVFSSTWSTIAISVLTPRAIPIVVPTTLRARGQYHLAQTIPCP